MPEVRNAEQVADFLVDNYGVLQEYALKMVENHPDILASGINLRSFEYYVAEEIYKAESAKYPDNSIPSDWFDPDFDPEKALDDNCDDGELD